MYRKENGIFSQVKRAVLQYTKTAYNHLVRQQLCTPHLRSTDAEDMRDGRQRNHQLDEMSFISRDTSLYVGTPHSLLYQNGLHNTSNLRHWNSLP